MRSSCSQEGEGAVYLESVNVQDEGLACAVCSGECCVDGGRDEARREGECPNWGIVEAVQKTTVKLNMVLCFG